MAAIHTEESESRINTQLIHACKTPTLHLEPVNGTAVNERRKLSQTVSEGVSNRTEGHNDVKVLFATIHKEGKESQRTQLHILVPSLGNGTYCLGADERESQFVN